MDFFSFLQEAPTVWHAAKKISSALANAGFTSLSEGEKWTLEAGKGYFVQREGALVAAFRLPKKEIKKAIVLASHTDSPALKIKPHPDLSTKGISQLGTEVYGGPLLHSWFDRDLAIAGQVQTDEGSKLVFLRETPVVIPQLAIHLDKTISEKGLFVHKQDHLKAVLSIKRSHSLEELLKKETKSQKIYAFDLFLVPVEKPSFVGLDQEIISGYRLDNLSSAYCSLEALIQAKPREDALQLTIFWDHEEIGSMSSTGADSQFLDELLRRICLSMNVIEEDLYRLKSQSINVSIDVAHGWNPNFAEKYDPQNSPLLGSGVALKFNANRKYASDTVSASSLLKIAEKHQLPIQKSANRSDIPSGSTVGPIMSSTTGIKTIDLGLACWAMHSTREQISKRDLSDLNHLLLVLLDEWSLS